MQPHRVFFILWMLFITGSPALGEEVALRVEGPAGAPPLTFTDAEIRAMDAVTFSTVDPWDKRERTYTGCPLLDFLKAAGRLKGVRTIEVVARNGYHAPIPIEMARKYGHILSYAMDGRDYADLGEEDKGPLAIAVEMERVDPADAALVKTQLVWWIERLRLK